MTAARVIAVAVLVVLTALPAAAQSSAVAFSRRPWVGTGFGVGVLTGPQLDGSNVVLAATLEVPVVSSLGVQVSAERLWSSSPDYGDVSIRPFSLDLMGRRTVSSRSTCDMQSVLGLGVGVYQFQIESPAARDPNQIGYSFRVGADCVSPRLAIGGLFGFRFIEAPDHPGFSSNSVIALTLTLTVRFRL